MAMAMAMARGGRSRKPVEVNVGGTVFHIDCETLQAAGPGSSLAAIAADALETLQTPRRSPCSAFLDRDPELFSLLLSVLRSRRLPRHLPDGLDLDLLACEAQHFGMSRSLRTLLAPPPLNGLDAEKVRVLLCNGRDPPAAIAVSPPPDGGEAGLCLGHGSKITLYDWALRRCGTTLTDLAAIRSLHMLSEALAAVGAPDKPGLHIYDVAASRHRKSFTWCDAQDPRVSNPSVHAIASSPSSVFASFSSLKGGDSTIAVVDPERLEVVEDMGRQRGLAAMAPTKLEWMKKRGVLVAGANAGGPPFGYHGHLRLFDPRMKEQQLWEWKEPGMRLGPKASSDDCFADWAACDEIDGIFKIGIASGKLELFDLRRMKATMAMAMVEDPWMAMEETTPSLERAAGGASNLLAASGRQVFCSRGGDLEVWAEVPLRLDPKEEFWETAFRRNYADQRRNMDTITAMASSCAADRLFVTRAEFQGVEVWETRSLQKKNA